MEGKLIQPVSGKTLQKKKKPKLEPSLEGQMEFGQAWKDIPGRS